MKYDNYDYYERATEILKSIFKNKIDKRLPKEAIDYISSIEKDELAILTLFLLRYHMPQKGEIK